MHLSRLEINGFKSFGEKVVLELAPGVTGVVGPNGSGKSNIVDAIRWVLGEQGYKGIRLEKSDDVIFLGSHGKGKMSRASVDMILSDIPPDSGVPYEELSISRYVYRDGEGEYFMNKAQVRLKDIHEMLARLHVSTKNYSIVTQGMSDQLLRFTPQELRATVEDASGVKEWQLKKRDAERKLEKSSEHAQQVQALLAELRPYLNNLRNQMKRWERRDEYAQKVQELKELKVYVKARGLFSRRGSIDQRRSQTQGNIKRLEDDKKRLTAEIIEAEGALKAESADKHESQEGAMQALYEKRMQLERELIRVESQLAGYSVARSTRTPDTTTLSSGITNVRKILESLAGESSLENLKAGIQTALDAAKSLEKLFDTGPTEPPQEIKDAQNRIRAAIAEVEKQLDDAKRHGREAYAREQQLKEALFQKERQLRRSEDDLARALEGEASLMEELGRFGEEERQIMEEAKTAIEGCPDALEGVLKILDTSYGGRELPGAQQIEEDLIRASVRLSDIGEIDPQVKSEFDKTEERFNFLSHELEDVARAKEDLQKLLVDLETDIRKKFEESFINVNEEFGKYMEVIFGGGKGELIKISPPKKKHEEGDEEIEEDEEGEESEQAKEGIAVHVELPGKRIKSLELLSGGERSLTSLAFLFALIATVKPPFVVLDEVDAALDESNSRRFADLLNSVKKETQCLVVTHNRNTMNAASALYGITMGGDGISRILSLKLE
jgi:chromosome segregation ATPase